MDAFTSAARSLRSWRWALIALALAGIAAALLVTWGSRLFRSAEASPSHAVPTAFAAIVRTDVIERQQDAGTLGFSGSYTVFSGPSAGVVTWLPAPGAIIRRGQHLYELDRRPIPLLYGYRPAIRDFALGMSDGGDVRELKQNLLALGFTAGGALTVDDHFDWPTVVTIEEWQHALGLAQTGTLPLGSVVFLPQAVRVSGASASVGAAAAPSAPILSATGTRPDVLVPLDAGNAAQVRAGDRVLVTMPDSTTVPGRIANVGRVATTPTSDAQSGGGPSTPTIAVTIALLARPATALDQAPVQVAITTKARRHVLAVPITALLAKAGGGYAVRVRAAGSTRLVPVTTGLFDDLAGRVEIDGPGLAAGMEVEVPAQ